MAGAFDRAGLLVELALSQGPIVMRAAVLDRVQGPGAVEHADLQVLPFDQAPLAGLKLGRAANFDHFGHVLNPSAVIGFERPSERSARRRDMPPDPEQATDVPVAAR